MIIRRHIRQSRGRTEERAPKRTRERTRHHGRKLRIPTLDRASRLGFGASLVIAAVATTLAATAPPATASPGQTLVVSTTGTDSGNCVSSPCLTLGYALSQAAAHDTISLEPGHYAESMNAPGTRNVVGPALSPLDIQSQSGLASNTVIEAVGQLNGIVVNADDVTIEGLTIQGAGAEGILVIPPTSAIAPSSVTGETIKDDVVDNDDQCISNPRASFCPAPSPDDDYGEAVHLESVTDSTLTNNTVDHNVGGILLTDEVGPTDANLISDNNVLYNAVDSGITLAGHSPKAVAMSGTDAGQPQPSEAGVFDNKVIDNVSSHNGAAGVLASATVPGAGAYDNSFKGNTATGDGLAGITIHSHTTLQDVNGNIVENNVLINDAITGGPRGTAGDAGGPPESANMNETTAVQVLAALAPLTGTVVGGNEISNVYYGVWISAARVLDSRVEEQGIPSHGRRARVQRARAVQRLLDDRLRRRRLRLRLCRIQRICAGVGARRPGGGYLVHARRGWLLARCREWRGGRARRRTCLRDVEGQEALIAHRRYRGDAGRSRLLARRIRWWRVRLR